MAIPVFLLFTLRHAGCSGFCVLLSSFLGGFPRFLDGFELCFEEVGLAFCFRTVAEGLFLLLLFVIVEGVVLLFGWRSNVVGGLWFGDHVGVFQTHLIKVLDHRDRRQLFRVLKVTFPNCISRFPFLKHIHLAC